MILIVDDDKTILMSLRLLLRRNGLDADLAASPDEALSKVRSIRYDLMIVDMNYSRTTSGVEGLELMHKLHIFQPDTPVILITAWGSIDLAVEGMRLGAFDFITKPVQSDMFLQRIRTALEVGGSRDDADTSSETASESSFDRCGIIGENPELIKVLSTVERIAPTDAPVLILGENGTGKEMIANAIHTNSRRRGESFIKVNLGGVPAALFESEMFGHVKGAFTGAVADRTGSVALADHGTLFLDEIGDLDQASQVKMLRVLQDHTFQALGDSHTRRADIRTVCATNADLTAMVAERSFREDLFYRINLITLRLPALRERREDIPALAKHFIANIAQKSGRQRPEISTEALDWLCRLPFPGNIRQLKNMTERALLLSAGNRLEKTDFEGTLEGSSTEYDGYESISGNADSGKAPIALSTLEQVEYEAVTAAIAKAGGNLSKAARLLGITRQSLYRRMDKFGIDHN